MYFYVSYFVEQRDGVYVDTLFLYILQKQIN